MDRQDTKTIKAEWLSVILLILLQLGVSIWWASHIDARVNHLERESEKGDRFTASDGKLLENDIQHIESMFDRHANRTEPKIDAIHNAVMDKYGHE